jgi:hypothetical protein
VRTISRALRLIAMSAAAAAGLACVATAGYAGAATTTRSAGPERPASTCVVTAARHTMHGRIRVVSALATECVTASGSRSTEAVSAKTKLVNIGYGCNRKNFSSKGPCWYFAVPAPGCKAGEAWIWKRLGVMLDKMKSWKAIYDCHSGQIYSRANLKGSSVLCSAICNSLGKLNDRDVSLIVGFGKTP